ncbi:MAG: peptidoglycan DD-metalloendopeptidase family protein [Gammaproteobacteria bacterium]|nr:peptidoglycan DD-metalloendopeptidase family protein [Gammaproteobacteria bacterium]
MRQHSRQWHYLLVAALLSPGVLAAPDPEAKQEELEEIRERISEVQQAQARDLGKRDELTGKLRSAEQDLAEAANALRETNINLRATEERLRELEAEQRARRAALTAERDELAAQIRAAYIAGREEKMKLLLNQQDPSRFGRVLTYYDYLNRARAARIDRVKTQLARLVELAADISSERERLESQRKQRQQLLARLEDTRDARAGVLAKLESAIRDRNAQLRQLQEDEAALANLVQSLLDVFADIPSQLDNRAPFKQQRGSLPWPSSGRVVANFGERRADGRMRWNGVMIAAEPGTPVRAVSHGRVAYADWLPHYGLLLVVEHGDGYMSLYGHNQMLYKEVGDWVEPGEIIAAIGNSGGQQRAALYFEIRNGRDVEDPRRWLGRSGP